MRFLFDASSIFALLEKGSPEKLLDNVTVNLAFYELGNVLWKEAHIFENISPSEMWDLQRYINNMLKLMQIISVEEIKEKVLDLSLENNITFYDASYVHPAVTNGWTFVTEDKELREKVKTEVKTLTAKQLLS